MKVENCDVGFIGLGVMGKSMAERLRSAGAKMHVFTRTKKSAEEILSKGALWYDDPASLAPNCKIIFTIVGYPQDVEQTYFGEKGLLNTAKPGTIFVDMTTSSPILAKKIYDEAKKKECFSVDAPVSGGDIGAKNGTLSIMAGGDESAFKELDPFFACMGKTWALQGSAGAGQHTKMANQIAVAANLFGAVEAVCYAEAAGLDPQKMLSAIGGGAAGSWQILNNGPKMLQKDFAPGFYIKHFLKDLNITLNVAKELKLHIPVLELAQNFFNKMNEEGYAEKGTQAIYEYYKTI
ncbi:MULTISPECIES: NAD(P)-dependent oxidoreductase [unclassified Treponema]|uniref:NAD(P)-dependent oxidoreductase n=1 Tax=unclassified Treponema TaxID=2638727 RepID=UPI0020A5ECD9|nr:MULTISPECIES: NAD(P)-dependent oxidoreductase [unclassified Treponema]UTC66200.1 NAD(P)-dependent oxidoreductase [Treponema sp. OMZ 789]UTC68929.1 NAD(P)-dependent oxidoreductase [Treponema sp. OMZ 790]UTC71657.1 NAD(P)-dependent oxidoreductase [Treponema sp. OMZ 791]